MLRHLLGILAVTATLAFPCAPAVVAAEIGYAPQISDRQGIKITVAPRNIREATKNWDFEVTVESHTQELSDDLAKSAMLIADGTQYLPLVWEGAPPGGHHRKGCSGLPVMKYKPETLHAEFGDTFLLVEHEKETHHTPFGTVQQFVYCYCRKGNS